MDHLSDIRAGRARERAWLVGDKAWMEQWCVAQAYRYAGSPLELKSGFAGHCRRLAGLHGGVLARKALRNLAQKAGFNPNQPRVPAGTPDGGQWTSEGGASSGLNDPRVLSDATPNNDWIPGAQYAQNETPPLQRIHPDTTYESDRRAGRSLDFWRQQSTESIVESLKPGDNKESLRAYPDGRIVNGNTRTKVLQERGYDINSLPREIVRPSSPGGGFGGGGGFPPKRFWTWQ